MSVLRPEAAWVRRFGGRPCAAFRASHAVLNSGATFRRIGPPPGGFLGTMQHSQNRTAPDRPTPSRANEPDLAIVRNIQSLPHIVMVCAIAG